MNYFLGCTALITGASSGIGRVIARQIASRAHALVLVARNLEHLEAFKADLIAEHPRLNVFVYGLDLRDGPKTDAFVSWLAENNLRVNFLVNNAGHGDYGDFETADWEKTESMIALNITALTRLTHRLIPTLKSFEDSAILNVSSVAGFIPIPQMAVYAATKAYVTSFSEALRIELRDSGISVTTLCPGPTPTGFSDAARRSPQDTGVTPDFLRIPTAQVVREALLGVAGDRARVIPGWKVAAGVALVGLLPMLLLRFGLARMLETRRGE
jgi:hypothetical protein